LGGELVDLDLGPEALVQRLILGRAFAASGVPGDGAASGTVKVGKQAEVRLGPTPTLVGTNFFVVPAKYLTICLAPKSPRMNPVPAEF
jgi:hypothetical protein